MRRQWGSAPVSDTRFNRFYPDFPPVSPFLRSFKMKILKLMLQFFCREILQSCSEEPVFWSLKYQGRCERISRKVAWNGIMTIFFVGCWLLANDTNWATIRNCESLEGVQKELWMMLFFHETQFKMFVHYIIKMWK